MFVPLAVLIIGLIILYKSSEYSIKYSVRLSKLMGITQLAIGFLLIAVITSLPELSIAILSSIEGEGLLSVGNLFGANIINMTLIFGIMAILTTVKAHKEDYKELIRTLSITSVVALVIILVGKINFLIGLFCIITFILFFYSIYKNNYKIRTKNIAYKGLKTVETIKTFFYTIGAILLVIISAKFVTDSAVTITQYFGVIESFIGATVIAMGTTLPELAISLTAIKRRNISLAVGDLIGSLVTNLTLILGVAALINPIIIGSLTIFLAIFMLITSMIFLFLTSAMRCSKLQGTILISIFIIYIISIINYQIFFI